MCVIGGSKHGYCCTLIYSLFEINWEITLFVKYTQESRDICWRQGEVTFNSIVRMRSMGELLRVGALVLAEISA